MNSRQIDIIKQQLKLKNGAITITSKQLAEAFGKQHKNVLRDIETLNCSKEYHRLNFEPVKIKDAKGELRKAYEITKDGYIMLVMGYHGRKAFRIKEAYITAFNAMTKELLSGKYAGREQVTNALLELTTATSRAGYKGDFLPKLIRYRRMGLSLPEIGTLVGLSRQTVGHWLQKCARAGIALPVGVGVRKKRGALVDCGSQMSLPGMDN